MTPPLTQAELLEHAPFLQRLARSLVRDEAAAHDVVQETWLTALQRPPRHRDNLAGWLRVVATTHAFRRRRGYARRARRELRAARPEAEPSAAELVERDQLLGAVSAAVLELGDPYREVLLLRFFEDLPPRRIARRLDRPINTVNSQLKRGLAKVRERLDEGRDRTSWCAGLVAATGLAPTAPPAGSDGSGSAAAEPPSAAAPTAAAPSASTLGPRVLLGSVAGLAVATVAWLGFGAGLRADPPRLAPAEGGVAPVAAVSAETAHAAGARRPAAAGAVRPEGAARPAAAVDPAPAPPADPPVGPRERRLVVLAVDEAGEPLSGATVAISFYGASTPADYGAWRLVGATGAGGRLLVPVEDANVAPPRGVDAQAPRVGVVLLAPGRVASAAHYVACEPGRPREVRVVAGPAGCAEIRGRVLDVSGAPVAGARVALANVELEPEVTDADVLCTAAPLDRVTDREGRFALPHLARARHLLFAAAPGYVPAWRWQDATHDDAVECVFHLRRGGVVRGVVRGADGEPVPGAQVGYELAAGSGPRRVTADGAGGYALEGVPPGPLELWARAPRDPTLADRTRLRVDSGAEVEWDPRLEAGEGVLLRLVDERGEPLAGWFVRLETADQRRPWVRRDSTDADGRVAFQAVPDGALRADLYRSSIEAGGRVFPVDTVEGLRPSARERRLVVRDRGDGGTLRGRLLDAGGRPYEEAQLLVQEVRGDLVRRFAVEPDGAFAVGDVPPGRYELRAWCGLAGSTLLGRHRVSRRETLELGEARTPPPGRVTVDWRWPDDPAAFAFHLVSRDGAAGDDWVQWSIDEGQWPIDEGPAAPRAEYALLPGTYGVQVERDGAVVEREVVRVESGETTAVVLGPE